MDTLSLLLWSFYVTPLVCSKLITVSASVFNSGTHPSRVCNHHVKLKVIKTLTSRRSASIWFRNTSGLPLVPFCPFRFRFACRGTLCRHVPNDRLPSGELRFVLGSVGLKQNVWLREDSFDLVLRYYVIWLCGLTVKNANWEEIGRGVCVFVLAWNVDGGGGGTRKWWRLWKSVSVFFSLYIAASLFIFWCVRLSARLYTCLLSCQSDCLSSSAVICARFCGIKTERLIEVWGSSLLSVTCFGCVVSQWIE